MSLIILCIRITYDTVDDPDNGYVASRIINHREDDIGQLEYLVVYKGYAKPYWTRAWT